MTKYKTMLQLAGYTNLPTIKNLELKSNREVLYTFDNYDITSVKKALETIQQKNKTKKHYRLNFTTKYYNINDNSIFKITKWEKDICYNRKLALQYRTLLLDKNNKDLVQMLGEHDKTTNTFEKVPCQMITTCNFEIINY
jgi:hypothetical protein